MLTIHKDFFAIALLAVVIALNQFLFIPKEVISYGSSDTYPQIVNLALCIFTVCYLFEALRRRRLKTDEKARMAVNVRSLFKPVALLACIWSWVVLVEHAGFTLPTAALLAASCLLYGERSVKKIALLSIIAPLFILFFFTALNSALPEGPLETLLLGLIRSRP